MYLILKFQLNCLSFGRQQHLYSPLLFCGWPDAFDEACLSVLLMFLEPFSALVLGFTLYLDSCSAPEFWFTVFLEPLSVLVLKLPMHLEPLCALLFDLPAIFKLSLLLLLELRMFLEPCSALVLQLAMLLELLSVLVLGFPMFLELSSVLVRLCPSLCLVLSTAFIASVARLFPSDHPQFVPLPKHTRQDTPAMFSIVAMAAVCHFTFA